MVRNRDTMCAVSPSRRTVVRALSTSARSSWSTSEIDGVPVSSSGSQPSTVRTDGEIQVMMPPVSMRTTTSDAFSASVW